ncbi:hypothetical protein [Synoicihabitans lomoniglobus]|uniref:Uncharacterized protein n=1 Tax=Synoicihabitans lomoniglobus TaxID=2909285 RepID=A0AAF0CNW5_9BACT|nr:hypothetical protein [Opitutaceae bacterium LMO-M01]WED64970.1 hypothetical protein PXH66_21695 [Opitutaceae bacterium LMO-M01]
MVVPCRTTLFRMTAALALLAPAMGRACWITPPDVVVEEVRNGAFFVRKLNQENVVQVWRAADMTQVWAVHLPVYDALFSQIILSPDGRSLIHLRGNHLVNKLDDMAVEVLQQDGQRRVWFVHDFRDDLPVPVDRLSASPRHVWRDEVGVIMHDRVMLNLAAGEGANIWFATPRMTSSLKK